MKKIKNKEIILGCIGIFVFLSCIILWKIGTRTYGNCYWGVLPASWIGAVTDFLSEKGMTPFIGTEGCGWDGQYYYAWSNEIFNPDTEFADVYTCQRIGMPLIAKIFSVILRQDYVYPLTFLMVSAIAVSLASYVYMQYVKDRNWSAILCIIPWIFSYGMIITVRDGLPDACGDAFFIIAFICLSEKRLGYLFAMSWAILSREFYIVTAFMIFAYMFVIRTKKLANDTGGGYERFIDYFKDGFSYAFPGAVYLGWQYYLCKRFHLPLSKIFSKGDRLVLPFSDGVKCFENFVSNGYMRNSIFFVLYVILLILCFSLIILCLKSNKKYLVLIPAVISVSMLDTVVMADASGFMKVMGFILLTIPLCIGELYDSKKIIVSKNGKQILYFFLLFYIFFNLYEVSAGTWQLGWIPYKIYMENGNTEKVNVSNENNNDYLPELPHEIELLNVTESPYSDMPFKKIFQLPYVVCDIKITNLSDDVFYCQDNNGVLGVHIVSQIRDTKGEAVQQYIYANQLAKDLEPGESIEQKIILSYEKGKAIKEIKLGLIQYGGIISYN